MEGRKGTYTDRDIARILSGVARKYHPRMVIFTTDSTDGLIGPDDTLSIFIVNNGEMDWCDMCDFSNDAQERLGREADCYILNSKTPASKIESLNGIVAYGY